MRTSSDDKGLRREVLYMEFNGPSHRCCLVVLLYGDGLHFTLPRELRAMSTSARRIEISVDSLESLGAAAPKERMALLLAGGDGKRLQELTTHLTGTPIPKQYCPLLRGRSLLELTLFRTRSFASPELTRVIINQNHLRFAKDQLRGLPDDNIFIQPQNRDTGPGMIFSLQQMAGVRRDPIVAVFPTDHFVDDDKAFISHALKAACLVEQYPDKIAILGIKAIRPETGYGYIMPGRALRAVPTPCRAFHVKSFKEKPSSTIARECMFQGGLWNTFVMVFRLQRMLGLLRELAPEGSRRLFDLRGGSIDALDAYREIAPWNFSSQILARIPKKLIVLEVSDVQWSDWGTYESVERTYRQMKLVLAWRRTASSSACRPA